MSNSFIYKYSPHSLNDFEITTDIIDLIKSLIKMNNLNILFIGDCGSGKTSLINAIMKEYYNDDSVIHENVLYINNLKDQGIHYYRNEVKTFCQTASVIKNKKKFIVLDDIDIINEQSQQVFRNCIDKYSHNINFIASCINSQKVIESLQSRLIIIKLRLLSNEKLLNKMNKIITNEQLNITEESKQFIVKISNHSIKMMINYLEKIKLLNQPIDINVVNNVCTNISFCAFAQYTEFCLNKNLHDAIKVLYELHDKGYSVMDILDNYFLYVKISTELNEINKYEIIKLICKYITIFHNIHEEELELALFTNNMIKLVAC